MLVLARKQNERIVIGENIVVTVLRIAGGGVRLGIEAPMEVSIQREEIADAIPTPARQDRTQYASNRTPLSVVGRAS